MNKPCKQRLLQVHSIDSGSMADPSIGWRRQALNNRLEGTSEQHKVTQAL